LTINIDIVSSATMFWLLSDARFYYGFIALLYTELQVTRVIKGNTSTPRLSVIRTHSFSGDRHRFHR
jgi:predicted small integral membrane protein